MTWDFLVWYPQRGAGNREAFGAPCSGFIVQRVDVTCDVSWPGTDRKVSKVYHYYEAWFVESGQAKSAIEKHGQATDTAKYKPLPDTEGKLTQKGEIRFYCMDEAESPIVGSQGTGDLRNKWVIWGRHDNPPCDISSGALRSIEKDPEFWENAQPVAGPATREFSVEWSCCRTENKRRFKRGSYVHASAEPLKETIQGALRLLK